MSSFDDYGLDDPSFRVYSHNEVMEALQNKIAAIAIQSQPTENSELLSRVAADNKELRDKVNKLSSVDAENRNLRSKIAELETKLENTVSNVNTGFSTFNGQLVSLNNMVTPVYTHYNNSKEGQIEVLKRFFQIHCRSVPGSRISAKELNEKVYKFSTSVGIPINKTEVKELVTSAPFNLHWYKSTSGIASYKDLEFIPIDLGAGKSSKNVTNQPQLPNINSNSNSNSNSNGSMSPRSPVYNGAASPAPVMVKQ
jgi:hypothetical protein